MEKRTGKFQLGRFWIEKENLLPKVGVVVPRHQYIDAGSPTLEVLKTQLSKVTVIPFYWWGEPCSEQETVLETSRCLLH